MVRRASLLALLATVALQGCVAAAIPIVAAGALGKRELDKREDRSPHTNQAPAPTPVIAATSAEIQAIAADAVGPPPPPPPQLAQDASGDPLPLPVGAPGWQGATGVPPLPAPATGSVETLSGYAAFFAGTLKLAEARQAGILRESAVLASGSSLSAPRFIPCGNRPSAVLIDIDEAGPPTKADRAEIAAGLSQLRAASITILWLTGQRVFETDALLVQLRASGLDASGSDQLIAPRSPAERKQSRRIDAAGQYCILAAAGDQRGDFDELFDYLRQPAAARALEPLFGTSWFIMPAPPLASNLATDQP